MKKSSLQLKRKWRQLLVDNDKITCEAHLRRTQMTQKMAIAVLLVMLAFASGSTISGEMALANITRFSNGDLFSLVGTDCGVTRCMEVSHGTALAAMGGGSGCVCQCRRETPAFREDRRICVNSINECPMASFGRGSTKPQIPFVFLPLKGQIIYPSKEIIFTDVEDAICAVTSAQYLSPSGWVTLRDLVDNDVPFGLYRDEGSTYLQWRGSPSLHARLEGRLVTAHVLCSAPKPALLAASCANFRIAGVTRQTLLDVRSIPFHAGETVTTEPAAQSQGLSVLELLAIGVCVLMIVFVYAAGIIFYIHYKQKQRRKAKDPELNHSHTSSSDNGSTIDSRIGMDSMRMKTNPLMTLESARSDYTNDAGLSDVSEHTEDTFDSSSVNTHHQFQDRNANIVSAVVHSRRKKPSRPSIRTTSTPERLNERIQRRSASPEIEKAPHSDLSILHCIDNNDPDNLTPPPEGEPVLRRKLYFNPVFFEIENLKTPPPAAIDFLIKLREVMSIAKEKMMSKRFIPILSDIPEEESYHTIDLGWDIPCARRGRRFSAISLKRENSRRTILCGGCPGCNSTERAKKNTSLIRSNSCKTCVNDDYKQKIVQKWLDEVPTPATATRPVKSIAKVSGTPRVIEPREKEEVRINVVEPVRIEETETVRITESIMSTYINDVNLKIEEDLGNHVIKTHKQTENSVILSTPSSSLERKSTSNHGVRLVRQKLPPPPPPPIEFSDPIETQDAEPVSPEVKRKMQAVIRELNKCRRVEPDEYYNLLKSPAMVPKLVIPVIAADSLYFNDDKKLCDQYQKDIHHETYEQFDSLERKIPKGRRFSLDYAASNKKEILHLPITNITRDRRTQSWRDLKISNGNSVNQQSYKVDTRKKYNTNNEVLIKTVEPIYNNIENPGPLTIEVRGSPVDNRPKINDDFDPDTLDRKPKKSMEEVETKKCVDKILLKSGGSFKYKVVAPESEQKSSLPEEAFTRKIGSLRQIYEARTKAQNDVRFYERRGSVPYGTQELAAYVKNLELARNFDNQFESKPPVPTKQKRASDFYAKGNTPRNSPPSDRYRSSEERDRFPPHSRNEERRSDINARRSGRRSSRTRPRRVDIRKLCRTEDSGYLSTDSNESKRRARYLMQLKPKLLPPEPILKMPVNKVSNLHIDTDTDDLESLCDGRSESGGESVETDSVFFGNFKDSKHIFEELGYGSRNKLVRSQEQTDSGFIGEPNTSILLSGDSDSEHKSVISIVTGCDGRASAASITNDDSPYVQSVEC